MPTSRRMVSSRSRLLLSSTPSTTMRPSSCFSSRLMQRIRVDLPEPDGPQMTIFSPRATARSTSRSTWKSPYHLFRPSIRMIGSSAAAGVAAVIAAA